MNEPQSHDAAASAAHALIVARIDDLRREAKTRFDGVDTEIAAVKDQAIRTNGRVTELERDRIARDAIAGARAADTERTRLDRGQLMQLAGLLIAFEGAILALVLAFDKLL